MRIIIAKEDESQCFMDLLNIGKNHCEFIENRIPYLFSNNGKSNFFACVLSENDELLSFCSSEEQINSTIKEFQHMNAKSISIEFPTDFAIEFSKFKVFRKYENKKHETYKDYWIINVSDENLTANKH
jgi:hypothetical protein